MQLLRIENDELKRVMQEEREDFERGRATFESSIRTLNLKLDHLEKSSARPPEAARRLLEKIRQAERLHALVPGKVARSADIAQATAPEPPRSDEQALEAKVEELLRRLLDS